MDASDGNRSSLLSHSPRLLTVPMYYVWPCILSILLNIGIALDAIVNPESLPLCTPILLPLLLGVRAQEPVLEYVIFLKVVLLIR